MKNKEKDQGDILSIYFCVNINSFSGVYVEHIQFHYKCI